MFFSIDELHIILKHMNFETCEHSSFFNSWRNRLLNQTFSSEIKNLHLIFTKPTEQLRF